MVYQKSQILQLLTGMLFSMCVLINFSSGLWHIKYRFYQNHSQISIISNTSLHIHILSETIHRVFFTVMSLYKLESSDGAIFTVDAATVKQMVTIQTMMDHEDEDSDEVTPVPTVKAQVLENSVDKLSQD